MHAAAFLQHYFRVGSKKCPISLARHVPKIAAMTVAVAAIACHVAEATDSPQLPHCNVSLKIDASGKASLSLQRAVGDQGIPAKDRTCQRHHRKNGECIYDYWFSDPKALVYLSSPSSEAKNVLIDPKTRSLHVQPIGEKEGTVGAAGFGLPYRVALPFEISVSIAATETSSQVTHFVIVLSPQHYAADTDEPTEMLIHIGSDDGFGKSATATVAGLRRNSVGEVAAPPKALAQERLAIGNNVSQTEFNAVLPVGAKRKAYSVFIGAGGTEAIKISRLRVSAVTQPFTGYRLQQIGDAVVVSEVQEASAAKNAGMRAGDRILSLNGNEVATLADAFLGEAEVPSGMDERVLVARRGTTEELLLHVCEPHRPPEGPAESLPANQVGLAESKPDAESSKTGSVTIGSVTIGSVTFGSAKKDATDTRDSEISVDRLAPPGSKAVLRINVGKIFQSEAGRKNIMEMLDSPTGQQQLQQLAQFQANYGFNYLTDLKSLTLMAPFPDGEPFNGVLLVAEGNYQLQRIERALSIAGGISTEKHEGYIVYEKTLEGSGRIYFAFLNDKIFIGSMERATVIDAIRQANQPVANLPKRLAEGKKAIPLDSSASLVLDASAFQRSEPEWKEFRDRVSWILISADLGLKKTVTGVIEAQTADDATVVRERLEKTITGGGGDQLFGGVSTIFRPDYDSLDVRQSGTRLTLTIQSSN